ncbi:MAG: hypothetical protein ACUVTZ_14890 [Armatimonadota bacterium]
MWSVLRWVAKALGALVLLVLLAEATIEIESEGVTSVSSAYV